jgi:hypothetical protein
VRAVLTPYDDFPIHPSADPIAHPATGDPNHYDRYWFNGHQRDGDFYFGAAMGHYPVRGVIDAAFSLVRDGVEHSVFASGAMPLDRSTAVGPFRIEVARPLRTIRYVVEPNEHGIAADLTFEATTVAIEEPRQRRIADDGVLIMDHTRLTQWGRWTGTVSVDGDELRIDPTDVPGTRDRSWGVRPVGQQVATNRPGRAPRAFWLWAPCHFGDRFTHLALHENADGSRWLESALVLDPLPSPEAPTTGTDGVREVHDIRYELDWEPGRREIRRAVLRFADPVEGETRIDMEKVFTFRMRGIGYMHPHWAHGGNHGPLETGRESIRLDDFDPTDFSSIHIQNLVRVRMGDRTGIGVLEQVALGPHEPTGLTGLLDGHPGGVHAP